MTLLKPTSLVAQRARELYCTSEGCLSMTWDEGVRTVVSKAVGREAASHPAVSHSSSSSPLSQCHFLTSQRLPANLVELRSTRPRSPTGGKVSPIALTGDEMLPTALPGDEVMPTFLMGGK
eukprot:CAMPEP_0181217212 /NCGR_PEP_ID=MMETSP1096-20121128/27024_1 /TAXON_ID=156174 ORGANISM="Chrysochromulina ericina, Strain CCMP281" /NCGR_SAMPLE_ID=MMETSP1096 /ASSEMBLY_ACC=CAM_ASM_000453 /LENGTH=120 /DNA_ID=CAMNT_0023309315 /DNA_START=358 /DNA_END=721 /DNA_ORIENTATION=+